MRMSNNYLARVVMAAGVLCASNYSIADGMQPATSVVLVNEELGEHSMNVKNTDQAAALLYTSLENIEEDQEKLLIATPPVARVEAGETQLVRFILQTKEPLKTQRLMRVYFEGIPLSSTKAPNSVGVTLRQNLPVIISPKELVAESEPWKHLKMAFCDGKLRVSNDSPYVVRLAQRGTLQPSNSGVAFPKTYILPQTKLDLPVESITASAVRIHPASVYGYAVNHYDAPITTCSR